MADPVVYFEIVGGDAGAQQSFYADLFGWQLAGDFFKAASLILGFCFYARRMVRAYLLTEAVSLLLLYWSSGFLLSEFGVEGLSMAYFGTYLIYFAMLALCFRKALFATR